MQSDVIFIFDWSCMLRNNAEEKQELKCPYIVQM